MPRRHEELGSRGLREHDVEYGRHKLPLDTSNYVVVVEGERSGDSGLILIKFYYYLCS